MPKKNDAWGIEVGANAIKAMRLVRKGEDVVVADYDVLPFKKVLTTPDVNVEEQIQLGLDQFLSRHDVTKSRVVVSVPGHMAFARFANLPPVEPKKIPDIVKFEAVQQIPFPIDQVEWDYQIFTQPDSPDVKVGIVAITQERVAQFLSNYQAVGLQVDGIVLSPMAVYNAIAHDLELTPESPGVIIMDIGTTSTDVIIVEHGQIWLRTLPIGGNHFTDALVRAFKLSFTKAERLKREAGTSKYARQIFQAMRPVFADLLQEMQRSLGYYQSLNRDAKLTKVIGVGSTFRLPGMQKFLRQQLQMDVERPDTFRRVKVEDKQAADFAEQAVNMVTAYGLALQGLGLERVTTNILPVQITKRKLWRAKQPWFAAAAAALVVAAGAAAARFWIDRNAFYSGVAEADRQVDTIIGRATTLKNELAAAKAAEDPMPQIENFAALLDYRDVWPDLMYDLTQAAKSINPQPELLTSDYEKIKALPAGQRRRLYIDSITAAYAFAADPQIEAIEQETAAAEESAAAAAMAPATDAAPAADAQAQPGEPEAAFERWMGEPAPVFTITITGTTPLQQAPNVVPRELMRWMKENAERRDRAYRIFAIERPKLELLTTDILRNTTGSRQPARRTATPAARPAPRSAAPPVRGGWGEDPMADRYGAEEGTAARRGGAGWGGETGAYGGDPRRGQQAQAPIISPQEQMLTRPLDEEADQRAWRFNITFKVQLLKPADARKVEQMIAERTPSAPSGPAASGDPGPGSPASPLDRSPAEPASPARAAVGGTEEQL